MINEKPPAPEEVGKYLCRLAKERMADLGHRVGHGSLIIDQRRQQLRECEAEMAALEREAFVLTKWTQDQ